MERVRVDGYIFRNVGVPHHVEGRIRVICFDTHKVFVCIHMECIEIHRQV